MGPVSTATKQSMMNARIQPFLLVTQSGTSACGMVPPPFRVGLSTSIHIIYTQKFVCMLILILINLIKIKNTKSEAAREDTAFSFLHWTCYLLWPSNNGLKGSPTSMGHDGSQAPTFKAFLWSGPFTVELLNPPSGSIVLSLSPSSHQRTGKDRSKKILE